MTKTNSLIQVQDRHIILSTLWILVVLCIAFADIIGFLEPGTLQQIIAGDIGFDLTPTLILIFSLLQAIPILMIPASRLLTRPLNRRLNLIAAVITLLYILGGGNWHSPSYYLFAFIEVIALFAIIKLAWSWKK